MSRKEQHKVLSLLSVEGLFGLLSGSIPYMANSFNIPLIVLAGFLGALCLASSRITAYKKLQYFGVPDPSTVLQEQFRASNTLYFIEGYLILGTIVGILDKNPAIAVTLALLASFFAVYCLYSTKKTCDKIVDELLTLSPAELEAMQRNNPAHYAKELSRREREAGLRRLDTLRFAGGQVQAERDHDAPPVNPNNAFNPYP